MWTSRYAWGIVDGCVDNSGSIDAEDGDVVAVATGACVRDAGWRALAEHSGERDRLGWPPHEHILRVVLRREHWEWVLTQLDRWEPYERDIPYTEARKLIRSALDSA